MPIVEHASWTSAQARHRIATVALTVARAADDWLRGMAIHTSCGGCRRVSGGTMRRREVQLLNVHGILVQISQIVRCCHCLGRHITAVLRAAMGIVSRGHRA